MTWLAARGVRTFLDLSSGEHSVPAQTLDIVAAQKGVAVEYVSCPLAPDRVPTAAAMLAALDCLDMALKGEGAVFLHAGEVKGLERLIAAAYLLRQGDSVTEALAHASVPHKLRREYGQALRTIACS